jgi:PAS domain S-box-containing protein
MAHVGLDGTWLLVNQRLCDFLGYPCDELQRRTFQDVTYPADLETDLALVRQLVAGEIDTFTLEKRYLRKDGTITWANLTVALVRDTAGQPQYFISVVEDINQRKRLEEERRDLLAREQAARHQTSESLNALLKMAEILVETPAEAGPAPDQKSVALRLAELARSVLGASIIYFAQLDPETELLYPLAALGLTPEQERLWKSDVDGTSMRERYGPTVAAQLLAGETLQFDFLQPEHADYPNLANIQRRLLAPMLIGQRVVGFLAVERHRPSQPFTPEEMALTGAVARLVALVLERERLWHEREAARAHALALREANQRMDEFMGIASHELKTPLTTIKMHVQLTARRLERLYDTSASAPEALPARVQNISDQLVRSEGQISRLTRLIDDLLDTSRIQAGKLALEMKPINLAEVVRQATEVQQQLVAFRAIYLHLPSQPVMVIGDAGRLEQVITNFLTNALKYSPPETPVEVHLAVEDGQARVLVRDQGPGIPLDAQERVWERFYRVPGVEVQSGSGVGMGLGLHISKTIIERHQGQVGVESVPSEGATFWLCLPLIAAGG